MRKIIYLNTILIYLIISLLPTKVLAESGAKTNISAAIPGRYSLRIFGYTSAYSLVQALGVRVFAQGTSDKVGYFMLENVAVSSEAREICVSAIDEEKRVSFPLCISLPETNRNSEIGPLLLAPTLSLSTSSILQNQSSFATGQTIPDEEVRLSFFESNIPTTSNLSFHNLARIFFPEVRASDLPILTTTSDKKGKFSMSLPSTNAVQYRLFAKAFYNHSPTPKSHTLLFSINPFNDYFFNLIIPWLLLIMIFLIIIAILIYIERRTFIGRTYIYNFREKKWKPFAVGKHLKLRRLQYNFRQWLRSGRK